MNKLCIIPALLFLMACGSEPSKVKRPMSEVLETSHKYHWKIQLVAYNTYKTWYSNDETIFIYASGVSFHDVKTGHKYQLQGTLIVEEWPEVEKE